MLGTWDSTLRVNYWIPVISVGAASSSIDGAEMAIGIEPIWPSVKCEEPVSVDVI